MFLLQPVAPDRPTVAMALDRPPSAHGGAAVVEVFDLVRRLGNFTAVDHVNFVVRRGEIFGCSDPTEPAKPQPFGCCVVCSRLRTERCASPESVSRARAAARERLGYVAQKFSLYSNLSAVENLEFFASAYGLRADRLRERIAWAVEQFDLGEVVRFASSLLPRGYKQRLAAALLHEPEILFLDEPTSGADPFARRCGSTRPTQVVIF